MPRMTVMMPARDCQSTISAAIASTLRGMGKDAELVVFDDASSDSTLSIAEHWAEADARVRLMSAPSSVGSGKARQRILDSSDSELVSNMDADDVAFPWRFRSSALGSSLDILFGAAVRFSTEKAHIRPTSPLRWKAEEMPIVLAVTNPLCHSGMSATREAINRVGGYRPLPKAQDYELWLRAAAGGARVGTSGIPVVGYRVHGGQVSSSSDYASSVAEDPTLRDSYFALMDRLVSLRRDAGVALEELFRRHVEQFRGRKRAYLTARLDNPLAARLRAQYADQFSGSGAAGGSTGSSC